uniref:Uncharacterized protein n=1 Tax=Lepeophtheirus salmonis TaxID=72036 RepID=A0A0K2SZ56_LEPSM
MTTITVRNCQKKIYPKNLLWFHKNRNFYEKFLSHTVKEQFQGLKVLRTH